MPPYVLEILLALAGIVASPYINEYVVEPFRFARSKGKRVAGEYFSVWYTATQNPPHTWEQGVIKQRGSRIRYKSINNDAKFDYEFIGTIEGDVISGHWKSTLPHDRDVGGGGTLYCSQRGHIAGFWIGDCKVHHVSWGYWAISPDRLALERFNANMRGGMTFKSGDIDHLFD
jgi:hypothetical protein